MTQGTHNKGQRDGSRKDYRPPKAPGWGQALGDQIFGTKSVQKQVKDIKDYNRGFQEGRKKRS